VKNDLQPPYDFDRYAKPFFPVAEKLEKLAVQAEEQGDTAKAADFFLRAACVYRTARQPTPSCDIQKLAWQRQRIAFYNGAKSVEFLLQGLTENAHFDLHADTWTLPLQSA
jgi:hypothetical protein